MPGPGSSPIGDAFGWAGRIMAVGLAMVLPGVGGRWLDGWLGTGFCEPLGFALGFLAGLTSLVRLARGGNRPNHNNQFTK